MLCCSVPFGKFLKNYRNLTCRKPKTPQILTHSALRLYSWWTLLEHTLHLYYVYQIICPAVKKKPYSDFGILLGAFRQEINSRKAYLTLNDDVEVSH